MAPSASTGNNSQAEPVPSRDCAASWARANYDRLSRWYDLLAGSEQGLVRLGVERLAVRPGEDILEIGPGTGHALVALARAAGSAGHVTGVDVSPGMLRRAAKRLERAGLEQQVRLVCAGAARIPLPPTSFDAVFLSFALELFDATEALQVLGECRRVLRPDGRLCIVSLAQEGGNRQMLRLYNWAHEHFPAWVDCRPIASTRLLQENGFQVQETLRRSLWGLPVHVVRATLFPEALARLLLTTSRWAAARADVLALLLVGSHARGAAKPTSDVDLVLVTDDPGAYLSDTGWLCTFGQPERVETKSWGIATSLCISYAGGPEVELALTSAAWLASPLDAGTMRVIERGYRILYDREGWSSTALPPVLRGDGRALSAPASPVSAVP